MKYYKTMNNYQYHIIIIKSTKGINFKHNIKAYHYLGISEAKIRIYNLCQGQDITCYQLLKMYPKTVSVTNNMGGKIR